MARNLYPQDDSQLYWAGPPQFRRQPTGHLILGITVLVTIDESLRGLGSSGDLLRKLSSHWPIRFGGVEILALHLLSHFVSNAPAQ
jgi:hypothetical protein